MLLDTNFQQYPSGQHVGGPAANVPNPGDGPGIGPAAPTVPYAPVVLPNGGFYSSIQSQPDGKSFPTAMTYWNRPLLNPNGSNLTLDFDLYVDAGISQANAFETDTMLVTAGSIVVPNARRNLSIQNVNGELYVIQKNAWVPFAAVPLFTPGLRYHHTIAYGFTPKTGSYKSVTINGLTYPVPQNLQVCDIELDNWSPSATMQLQQSLIPTGAKFGLIIDHLTYSWG
jgi:hypothetical protein